MKEPYLGANYTMARPAGQLRKLPEWAAASLCLSIILLAALLVTMPALWLGDQFVYNRDIDFFFPHEVVNRALLAETFFPLWNPYFGAGAPQLGKIQAGLFYPPAMILRPLPVVTMMNVDAVGHLFLAGAGVFVLLRGWQLKPAAALGAGLVFMFSGAVLPRLIIGHVTVLHTIVWSGWLLWAIDRFLKARGWGKWLLIALFASLILLGGHPQFSALVLVGAAGYSLFGIFHMGNGRQAAGKVLVQLLLAAVLAICLVAFQLIPYLEWQGQTSRGQGAFIADLSRMTANSLNVETLSAVLTPLLWYSPTTRWTIGLSGPAHYWEASPFITVTALLSLIMGLGAFWRAGPWQRHYALALAAAGLLMSLGQINPLYEWFFRNLPLFRGPGRFLIWWALGLALLTGLALDDLLTRSASLGNRLWRGLALMLGLTTAALLLAAAHRQWGDGLRSFLQNEAVFSERDALIAAESMPLSLRLLLGTTVALTLLLWLAYSGRIKPSQLAGGLIFLLMAEGLSVAWLTWQPQPVGQIYQADHPLARLTIEPGAVRIPGYREPPVYLVPTLDHVRNGDEHYLLARLLQTGGERGRLLFGAGFTASAEPLTDPAYRLRQEADGAYLYEQVNNLPRIYVAGAVQVAASEADALSFVLADDFIATRQAVVTLQPGQNGPSLTDAAKVAAAFRATYLEYGPKQIVTEVWLDRPGLVVFNEMAYDGWEATVDGRPTPIYRANYAFRGIAVTAAGNHQITMTFRPRSAQMGGLISSLTVSIILVGSAFSVIRTWAHRPGSPTRPRADNRK